VDGTFQVVIYADDILLGENVNTIKFTVEYWAPSVRARACVCVCVALQVTGARYLTFSWFRSRACRGEIVGFFRGAVPALAPLRCYVAYVGPLGSPETPVTSYELKSRNIQGERESRVRRYWI